MAVVALALLLRCWNGAAQGQASDGVVIAVAADGDDGGQGTREKPFKTLKKAQMAVRQSSANNDVTVELGDGEYRIARSKSTRLNSSHGGISRMPSSA